MSRVIQPIETKPPIMELRTHFFPEIYVRANPKLSVEELTGDEAWDFNFETDIDVQTIEKHPDDRYVTFSIRTDESDDSKAWEIDVTIVGQFRFLDKDCPEDARTHFSFVTGQSILYGVVREMVHSLTLKGPYGPVYLPTVTFVPTDEERQKALEMAAGSDDAADDEGEKK